VNRLGEAVQLDVRDFCIVGGPSIEAEILDRDISHIVLRVEARQRRLWHQVARDEDVLKSYTMHRTHLIIAETRVGRIMMTNN